MRVLVFLMAALPYVVPATGRKFRRIQADAFWRLRNDQQHG